MTTNTILIGIACVVLSNVLLRVIACFLIGVIAHELGHLAAGLLAGWEFSYIFAGPFMVSRGSRGLHFRLLPRWLLRGGRVQMLPKGSNWTRLREGIPIAGGPVVTALLFLPVLLRPWSPWSVCFLVANTVIAAGSWLPFTANGQANDARLLIQLVRRPPQFQAAIRELWSLTSAGVQPCDWTPKVIEQLAAADDPILGVLARQYTYAYASDCGDPAQAARALESVLESANDLPPDLQRTYFAEAAFFQGTVRKNPGLARDWLDDAREVSQALSHEHWESYPLAAIAWAEGRHDESRKFVAQLIAAMEAESDAGGFTTATRARLLKLTES